MIASDLGRALLLASVPLAAALGVLSMAQLYIVAFAAGSLSVFFQVADSTLFVCVVDRDRYLDANSLVYGSRAVSFMAGPSLGGILTQVASAPVSLLVDAVSFLGSAGFLSGISPAEPPPQRPAPGHLTAGVRYIRRTPTIFYELASTATVNFFNLGFFALFLLYATRSLHVRAGTLGVVLGLGAIGGLLGAVVTRPLTRRIGVGPSFCLASVLFPAPLLLVPLAAGPRARDLPALPGRVQLGHGRHDPRHHRGVDQRRPRPRPPARPRPGRLHDRELRRAATGVARSRPRRGHDRHPHDPLDRDDRRRAQRALARALAPAVPADAARDRAEPVTGEATG